jgi:Flp pilus assembly protein TadB
MGSFFLSACGVPQAWACIKSGNSDGISNAFLWLWGLGEIFTFVYVLNFSVFSAPLIVNYGFNIVSVVVIMRYKYWPKKTKRTFPSSKDAMKHQYD